MEQDLAISELGLTEEDVRLAGEGKHADKEVNDAVASAVKVRQRIITLIEQRAVIKNSFERNKAKDRLDNTVVELGQDQVPSSDGIIELSK